MKQRVLITRAQPQAAAWVRDLAAQGWDAQALPLIDIQAVADVQPLRQAWARWRLYRSLMFVSGAAVQHFFTHVPWATASSPQVAASAWLDGAHQNFPRAWATGPGTLQALQQAGWPRAQIDAPARPPFDSEALWLCVAAQVRAKDRVLIVRGAEPGAASAQGGGRDWLAQQVLRQGAQVEFVAAYQRCVPTWGAPQRALAHQAASDGSVWLLSSSQAVAHLCLLLPQQSWQRARALATHPRIAQAAQQAGFAEVVVTSPTLEAVVASIKSWG